MSGFSLLVCSTALSISKSTAVSRSILLINIAFDLAKMAGYFAGLSSPSGTERTTILQFSPSSKAVGQTRLPTFSMKIRSRLSVGSLSRAPATCDAER